MRNKNKNTLTKNSGDRIENGFDNKQLFIVQESTEYSSFHSIHSVTLSLNGLQTITTTALPLLK